MLYAPGRAGSLGGPVKAGVRRQTTDHRPQTTWGQPPSAVRRSKAPLFLEIRSQLEPWYHPTRSALGIGSAATFSVASQLQLATAAFFIGVAGRGERSLRKGDFSAATGGLVLGLIRGAALGAITTNFQPGDYDMEAAVSLN